MSKLFSELEKLHNYRFIFEEYKFNHSELVLSAVNTNDPSHRFRIGFGDVSYLQMPIGWTGSFTIGSEDELKSVINKLDFPVSSTTKLYKANNGEIIILGTLMQIKQEGEYG